MSQDSRSIADAPLSLGPDDRLHNSGWGRPPEQYRTPAIGARFRLHFMRFMRAWPGVDPEDARALAGVLPRDGRLPPRLVARYAWSVARALGCNVECSDADDPIGALTELAATVDSLGLARGVVLTARTADLYKCQDGQPPADYVATAEQVGAALVTAACCSPPLVLWGRTPSLSLLRPDKVLLVARMRRTESAPEADRVWNELQALGTPAVP